MLRRLCFISRTITRRVEINLQQRRDISNSLFSEKIIHQDYKMAENASGKYLKHIIEKLEDFAPLNLAESWDNVGLLVDPIEHVLIQNILLTNDLTEDVVEEAIKLKVGLIISYHPNIFQGLKSISSRTWKERIVVQCLKNNIAVFSPHTTWDLVKGGVNDWLVMAFQAKKDSVKPIKENGLDASRGAGRIFSLHRPITIEEVLFCLKKHLPVNHLHLALARNKDKTSTISSIALCAGSGSSILGGVPADLYFTGEMSHHDILNATQNGIHVVLSNHSNSERGYLTYFRGILMENLNKDCQIFVSNADSDPLQTV